MMQIEKVGIAGFEGLGSGIVHVVSGAGYDVSVWSSDGQVLERGKDELNKFLDEAVGSGTIKEEEKDNILDRLVFSTDMTVLKDADLVIESVSEDLDLKKQIFSHVSALIKGEAVLATSTACYSVTEIGRTAKNPQRTLGMHFFKPPHKVKLVEVVRSLDSSQEVIDLAVDFCAKIGKETVVAKDSPGFIVNYLFVPYMNQALRYYDQGLADKEGLDTALRMGLGYPTGPLTLIDHLGLDEHLHLTSVLYDRLKDPRFAPPPILKRMVDGGRLGKKTGQGFYTYDEDS
ncbi:MAG: 3-hydroxyacyl-CoA dehydrogenase family protein [Pseudomonadota bacterium]